MFSLAEKKPSQMSHPFKWRELKDLSAATANTTALCGAKVGSAPREPLKSGIEEFACTMAPTHPLASWDIKAGLRLAEAHMREGNGTRK